MVKEATMPAVAMQKAVPPVFVPDSSVLPARAPTPTVNEDVTAESVVGMSVKYEMGIG
jgi:hypothetical protein